MPGSEVIEKRQMPGSKVIKERQMPGSYTSEADA